MTPLRFFIDANVLLSLAEPDSEHLHPSSRDFLQQHESNLVTGPLVALEVAYQLRTNAHHYRGAKAVKRWLLKCEQLDFAGQQALIEELGLAYAEKGWHGDPGDNNDRLHAATASALHVSHLVTWERRLLQQQAWISEVNRRYQLDPLSIIRPDTRLSGWASSD